MPAAVCASLRPALPNLRIALRPAQAGSPPEFLFPVSDARKAAGQLKDAGVNATRNDKLVFVHDPDGNMFIFLEAGRLGLQLRAAWDAAAFSCASNSASAFSGQT